LYHEVSIFRSGLRRPGKAVFVVAVALTLASSHAQPQSGHDYVEGEVLVTFKTSAGLETSKQALKKHSLGFARHYNVLSAHAGKHIGLIRDHSRTTASLLAELSTDPSVETVEPNYLRWPSASGPNDPLFAQQWSLRNTAQSVQATAGTAGADVRFPAAWVMNRPVSTNPPVVAVLDTGIYYAHPDLVSNLWVNASEVAGNGLDDDENGYADDVHGYDFAADNGDVSDTSDHGTHVSGTIAATANNGIGVAGVASQAKIMMLKVSLDGDSFSSSALVEGLQYAVMMKNRGVNVVAINGSYGGVSASSAEKLAIQTAGDHGIIFCAAAGNDGTSNDESPKYPANYLLPNIIVVAVTDQNDALASFSNFGSSTVDIAAPGRNILSTVPPGIRSYVHTGVDDYPAEALTYSGTTTGITARLVDCKLGYATNFSASVKGNIALIQRGTIHFSEKVRNAMNAGALGAVIYNNISGMFYGTLENPGDWIPSVSITQDDGSTLLVLVGSNVTLVSAPDPQAMYAYLDGTSMAAPHVTGAVALAALDYPDETVAQRKQRVLESIDLLPNLSLVTRTGGRLNLLKLLDSDGNGLPDWWEQVYFGQPTGTDPAADPDGDGLSNVQEFVADTNPTNSLSSLRILSVSPVGSGARITWSGGSTASQVIERALSTLGPWVPLYTNLPPASASPSLIDTAPGPDTTFYRVRAQRP